MSNRADRREKLRERMKQDAANRDKGSGRNIMFDFSDYEEVHFFKAKKGKNEIDILPFEVTTENDPMKAEIGEDQYKLEYWQHNNIGPKEDRVLCLLETYGKPCPICEAKKEMLDAGADWKDEEVKALSAKRRCMYNIIDLNDTEKGVQLFEQSHFKFEKELFGAAEYKNPDFICFADIEEGYTVTFRGSEETFNKNKFIEPKDFDFEAREPYDEDIYNDVYPLDAMLNIPTYDQVQALFMGVETDDNKEDETPDEKPAKETKKRDRKSKAPDRTTAKEGREKPARGSRRQPAPEPEPEEEDIGVIACPEGLVIGVQWDTKEVCQECEQEMYDKCEALYKDIEANNAKQAAEKAKKEDKPSRRPRRR